MSITLFKPEPDVIIHQALGKACEEASELSNILARCMIQGLDKSEPATGKPNRKALSDEISDLDAAVHWLRELIGDEYDAERADRKLRGFRQWQRMLEADMTSPSPQPNSTEPEFEHKENSTFVPVQKTGTVLHPAPGHRAGAEPVRLTYTNWRGEIAKRTIAPKYVWFGSTDWHPHPQWLLKAFDLEKGEDRDFALKDFGEANFAATETANHLRHALQTCIMIMQMSKRNCGQDEFMRAYLTEGIHVAENALTPSPQPTEAVPSTLPVNPTQEGKDNG